MVCRGHGTVLIGLCGRFFWVLRCLGYGVGAGFGGMIPAQKSAFVQLRAGNVRRDMGLYECCDDDGSVVRLCTIEMSDGMTVMTNVCPCSASLQCDVNLFSRLPLVREDLYLSSEEN